VRTLSPDTATVDPAPTRPARAPTVAFALLLVAAVPAFLHLGRHRWFQYDEWDFLAARDAHELHDLFAPHNVHWSTLPILVYRSLWEAIGIRSYVPYMLGSILTHLVVVALLLVVMRRALVRPWVATAAAAIVLLLGSGDEDIFWAFQITFNGSLAFGLGHLLLADHDGPVRRRDWIGIGLGLAGLMCSGVGVTMVLVVGLAALARRGWRAAAFHTAPLAAAYAVWYLAMGDETAGQADADARGSVGLVGDLVEGAVGGLGQLTVVGWLVPVLLVVGLVTAWRSRPWAEARRRVVAPAALLAGSGIFVVVTALGRGGRDVVVEANNRYVYVAVVLAMPALAVAADAVMRRWRLAVPAVAAMAAVALVGNALELRDGPAAGIEFRRAYRSNFLALPRVPLAEEVSGGLHPDLALAPYVSYGWMRFGVATGRFPEPPPRDPAADAAMEVRLVLRQQRGHEPQVCETVDSPADLELVVGSSIVMSGPTTVVQTRADGVRSMPVTYQPAPDRPNLLAYAGPLRIRVESPSGPFQVCDLDGGPVEVEGLGTS
jgi:hypothetical protein